MDKADITAEVVATLLREQYPAWADLPVRAVEADGNINSSFRLGDDLVVRLPGPYNVDVDKELRWLPKLASHLPLPIPQPVAKGLPSTAFPRDWAIYRWLEGERPDHLSPEDRVGLAVDVARFLGALYRVNTEGGPPAGDRSFGRGGPLTRFHEETRKAIAALGASIDSRAATAVWDAA